ncbi:hypothetical protein ACR9GP_25700 [Enterobacter ludwigii]
MSKEKRGACSMWPGFPDVLFTQELCRASAQRKKRNEPLSLRACARTLARKMLEGIQQLISKSQFPEMQISQIRGCIRGISMVLIRTLPHAAD